MLAVAVIDSRRLVIPDELSALAAALGLVNVSFERWEEMLAPVLDALIRGTVSAALFFAFRLVYRRLRGREGIGFGDVKLAGVAGIWLDWISLPVAVDIAALTALGSSRHESFSRAAPQTLWPNCRSERSSLLRSGCAGFWRAGAATSLDYARRVGGCSLNI